MILTRFYDDKLAHASYLVGCTETGQACVIDPGRDIQPYLDAAKKEKVQITAVTETHIHADFVSGSRELGKVTGATVYLSDEGDAQWKYAYANEPNVRLVRSGDKIKVGEIELGVVHTPGHTPEHISFILTDPHASSEPMAAFTGDFVFVGDVGRPDLLERAANMQGTMVESAKRLYGSVQNALSWSPHLLVWPAHGAGSACGKSLGGVPVSTVGFELRSNWAFKVASEAEFVESVLEGQPEPPAYFKHMKRINKIGPPFVYGKLLPKKLDHAEISTVVASKANLIDLRSQMDSARGTIETAKVIEMANSFPNWAGWLMDYDKPTYLIADSEAQISQAVRDLQSVGLDDVAGWFDAGVIDAWRAQGNSMLAFAQMDAEAAADKIKSDDVVLLDVRSQAEYGAGHIEGALHIPLGALPERIDEVPQDRPIICYCQADYRGAIAAGIAAAHGFEHVSNVLGGYPALRDAMRATVIA